MLKWKDSQRLVVWMMDEYKNMDTEHWIATPYQNLSQILATLYDPVTGGTYNRIQYDTKWWMQSDMDSTTVLKELSCVDLQFKVVQEILRRSNPSLNPVTFYGQNSDLFVRKSVFVTYNGFGNQFVVKTKEDDDGDWYISCDYDC